MAARITRSPGGKPGKDPAEPDAIVRAYDLIRWALAVIARFPRSHRFVLGERMERGLYEVLERLVEARYDREGRAGHLALANLRLEVLRFQFRLAHDLEILSTRQYEHATGGLLEVGTSVGAWLRASRAGAGRGSGARGGSRTAGRVKSASRPAVGDAEAGP